jgi:hypothetical protein
MRSRCVKLTWQTSEMVNCLHAAEAWLRSPASGPRDSLPLQLFQMDLRKNMAQASRPARVAWSRRIVNPPIGRTNMPNHTNNLADEQLLVNGGIAALVSIPLPLLTAAVLASMWFSNDYLEGVRPT